MQSGAPIKIFFYFVFVFVWQMNFCQMAFVLTLVVCSLIVVYFSLPVAYLSTSTIHRHAARIQISDTPIESSMSARMCTS